MATINGSTSSSLWTFKLVTTEGVYNIDKNTSPLTVAVYIGRSSSSSGSYMQGAEISCSINVTDCEQQILSYHDPAKVNVASGGWVYIGSKTFTVTHNEDGSKTVTVSASFTCDVNPNSGSARGSVTLATIPRATTPVLSAASVTMGSGMTITLTPASSSFKHKLRYTFGSLSSQVTGFSEGYDYTPAGNRTVTFTPPTSLGSQIPNANSGTCTIDCYTYTSGGTHVGTKSVKLTLNVPSYSPAISVSLTGNNLRDGVYVQGKSTATIKTVASGVYGSTITSYSCTVDGVKYDKSQFTTSALKTAGEYNITVTVKDGRGKTASATATAFTVYAYKAPYISSFTAERQEEGTTVIAKLVGEIASLNGKNGKVFTITLNGETKIVPADGYIVNGSVTFTGVDSDSTFVATAKIADSYPEATATTSVVVPTVAVTMDFHNSGKGVAFGKVAESENTLDVAWDIKCKGSTIRDFVVEQDTNGLWTYRKWYSGIAECWGAYLSNSVNVAAHNYSGFCYSDPIYIDLPFDFTSVADFQANGGSNDRINFARQFGASNTNVAFVVCGHQADATSTYISVYLSVKGKWK